MIAISIPEERWFSAAESLPTLRGRADWVRSTPMVVRGRKRVLADLERMEQILERMTKRRLPPENSFWSSQAQRLLSDYLWREGKVPATRKLTVKDVDRDELLIAARWEGD